MGCLLGNLVYKLFLLAVLILGLEQGGAQNSEACTSENGCAVLVPNYWTFVGNVNFNFTGLEERGPINDFQWGLGTSPGVQNTVPYQSLAGSNLRFNSFTVNTLEDENVTIGENTFVNRTVYTLNYTLPGQSLLNGQTYYVSVQATGNNTLINATSKGVKVATSTPAIGPQGYLYNTADCSVADTQRSHTTLWACWDPFVDPVTQIVDYTVTAYELQDNTTTVSPAVDVGLQRKVHLTGLTLNAGGKYYVAVTATNAAGLSGMANSPAVLVLGDIDGLSTVGITFVVAAGIITVAILIFLVGYLFFRRRYKLKQARRQQDREKTKVLKSLMYSLVNSTNAEGRTPAEQLRDARNLAFVITDLQSSTAQAAASPHAFLKIQEIHDTVIREGIAKHNGYEINTEGDAFHIAFSTVPQAVLFCMETQYRLLDTAWPREVLRLPACGEVTDKEGNVLMRGPRVRMGIHYAVEGTVAHRLHLLTKHRVFSGPGFQVAVEVGDAANGGQVLLTHDAWLKLEASMAAAGFPTVKQIGLYKLNAWPSPIWIYEVSQLLGRQLQRVHGEPRKIKLVETGWGLNIVPPPEPRDGKFLTFVAMRLDSSHRSEGRPPEGSSIRATLSNVVGASSNAPASEVSPQLARQLFEALATSAMQFRGYIHHVREAQGIFGAVFHQTLDAVRFAHAAQTRLLYTSWPNSGRDPHCGPVEFTPDGRLLFYGPRVAMAIHETAEFEAERVALPSQGQREYDVHYFGDGVAFTQLLGLATHGGQVLLSESAWASVQDQIPGSSQVMSLGTHIVDPNLAGPMLLMELMPTILGRRSFPPPATAESIEPGFRDSPDPTQDMALVFTKVARPAEVIAAEQGQMRDEEIVRILTAFNIAISKISRLVRLLLPDFDGYECKEPEPGKFTLAFHTLEAAVRWAAVLQKELLEAAWPEAILEWPNCQEAYHICEEGNKALIWKGPRVRIGMACGKPQYRKPLNTGRADYYGSLPNLAARVAALAHPGQILVEGSSGFREEVRWLHDENIARLSLSSKYSSGLLHDEDIELHLLGFYLLKGLDDAKPIIQANPASLSGRHFEPLTAAMRVGVPARRNKSGSLAGLGSFLSIPSADSQTSGRTGSNAFTSLVRTGSKMFSGVLGDIPPLPGLRSKGKSLPANNSGSKDLEEEGLELTRPPPGKRSPWGSFADTLAQRVRAVAEVPRQTPSIGSQRAEPANLEDISREGSENGWPAGPVGSPDSDWHLPQRVQSLASSNFSASDDPDAAGRICISDGRAVSLTTPTHAADDTHLRQNLVDVRSRSMPGVKWQPPLHQNGFDQRPPRFPSVASSPATLQPNLDEVRRSQEQLRDRTSPTGDYAEEVAQTFAGSRLAWHHSVHAPSNHKLQLKRIDTPKLPAPHSSPRPGANSSPESLQGGDSSSGAVISPKLSKLLSDGLGHSPLRSLPATDGLDGTPRELAPRTASQISSPHRPVQLPAYTPESTSSTGVIESQLEGKEQRASPGRDAAHSPLQDGQVIPGRGTLPSIRQQLHAALQSADSGSDGRPQRSSSSELSHDSLKIKTDSASAEGVPRSASGSALRVSRFTTRRNAVLDVAHRRQVAQEGLMEVGNSPVERTWSFATEGTHQSEIATVPEEGADPDEIELTELGMAAPDLIQRRM